MKITSNNMQALSTIYSEYADIMIWFDDLQTLGMALGHKEIIAEKSRIALIKYFFPDYDDSQVADLIFRLNITGKRSKEFEVVKDFYYKKRDEAEALEKLRKFKGLEPEPDEVKTIKEKIERGYIPRFSPLKDGGFCYTFAPNEKERRKVEVLNDQRQTNTSDGSSTQPAEQKKNIAEHSDCDELKKRQKRKHNKGQVSEAYTLFQTMRKSDAPSLRQFKNWLSGKNVPAGFPGIMNMQKFIVWVDKWDKPEKKRSKNIRDVTEEEIYKKRKR